jgi:hypothetical protein
MLSVPSRRSGRQLGALVAVGVLAAATASHGAARPWRAGTRAQPDAAGSTRRPQALPAVGAVDRTIRFSLHETPLFAARGDELFILVIPQHPSAATDALRVNRAGSIMSKRIALPLSGYLWDVSAGSDGVYAGTAVIKRFTNVADSLVRIDPETLTIKARASFPSRVAAIEHDQRLWASVGDGQVVRLDPRTLRRKASRQVVPTSAARAGTMALSKPAFGLGSVWVLAGNAADVELVRMDPASLVIRSRTKLTTSSELRHQGLNRVLADTSNLYVVGVGGAILRIDARGRLIGRPVVVPNLQASAIHRPGLIALVAARPAVVELDAGGRIAAKTALIDDSGDLVVSGNSAWFLGNAGQGNGVVQIRLSK